MNSNSHILITGADGFVGRSLSRSLLLTGAKVSNIVRSRALGERKDETYVVADLACREEVLSIFSLLRPNYVVHLAGSKSRVDSFAHYKDVLSSNLSISLNVIEACQDISSFKRLVFLGSCDEYGEQAEPFDESQRELPSSGYGLSKLMVTRLLSCLYRSRLFPSVVLRPSVIYGPGQGREMFLSAFIHTLLNQQYFAMTLGGQLRDFIYIDDVIEAIIRAIYADERINGAVLNIAAGLPIQLKKVAIMAAAMIHPDSHQYIGFGAKKYRPNEVMNYAVNITRAARLVEWRPSTTLEQGLLNTIDQYRNSVGE